MSIGRDFDDERAQREWDAQERALAAERADSIAFGSKDLAQYRLIARALRRPPLDALPTDFAAKTAARALREARIANDNVEVWLGRGLVALLLLAGALAISAYGGESWFGMSFTLPERAAFEIEIVLSWIFAIAACVGLSSVFALARKH